jgi:hypothetical protein
VLSWASSGKPINTPKRPARSSKAWRRPLQIDRGQVARKFLKIGAITAI